MLVARKNPIHLAQIDAVFILQNAARPHAGRDRIAAIDADALALKILRRFDARVLVDEDRAVMERAHDEDRNGGEFLLVRLRAHVGGDGEFANVELIAAHHATEGGDQRVDLNPVKLEALGLDAPVFQGGVGDLSAGDGLVLLQ